MNLRWQVPVHSPLPLRAILAGLRARRRASHTPRREVDEWIERTYRPRAWLLTDSGTSALALALRGAVAVVRRREVALPGYCCYDVATAADAADVGVRLYDLEPASLGPDWNSLRAAIRPGVAAAVVADLYGTPVDLGQARALADEAGAILIEDAAQGAGASYSGRPLGSYGSLAVLSFGRGKGVTGGGGGALLAHDDRGLAVLDRVRRDILAAGGGVREVVAPVAQWALGRPVLYAIPSSLPFLGLGETNYRPPAPARDLSDFNCGVLSVTLRAAAAEAETRRRNAERLLRRVALQRELTAVKGAPKGRPGFLRLPVLAGDIARERASTSGARRLGIMPGYPRPLAHLPGFVGRVANAGDRFPGASFLASRLITLPVHGFLARGDLERLEEWIDGAGMK